MSGQSVDIYTYSVLYSGPVMFQYVWWILTEAVEREISTLYFLARDGFALHKIAERFCEKFNLPIECRYLYCSRKSLRGASYHLLSREEAIGQLMMGAYLLTPRMVLKRGGLCDDEVQSILCQLHVTDPDVHLNKIDFAEFRAKVITDTEYIDKVQQMAATKQEAAIQYFRQEGLLKQDHLVIVDSGWTGSMQRSLRVLLDKAGYKGSISGFYFGMFCKPKEQDGTYFTYYFRDKKQITHRIFFNNNLFECYLSAPHGMTLEYKFDATTNQYVPLQADPPQSSILKLIEAQIQGFLDYTQRQLENLNFSDYNKRQSLRRVYRLLKRCMANPTREEVLVLGRFGFCDDMTEAYSFQLADSAMRKQLAQYTVFSRAKKILFKAKSKNDERPIYWPYAVIAFEAPAKRIWYRVHLYIWEYIRCLMR